MGAPDLLRTALAPLVDRIRYAGIYGSPAEGRLKPSSGIDVLVLGDVEFAEVTDALASAEESLGRPVNSTMYSMVEFEQDLRVKRHFLSTVLERPLIALIGELPSESRQVARERVARRHPGAGARGSPAARRGRPKSG